MKALPREYPFTVADVARRIGRKEQTVYAMVARGEIACLRGGRLRFSEEDIQAWIEAHRSPAVRQERPVVATPRAPRAADVLGELPMPARRRFA